MGREGVCVCVCVTFFERCVCTRGVLIFQVFIFKKKKKTLVSKMRSFLIGVS